MHKRTLLKTQLKRGGTEAVIALRSTIDTTVDKSEQAEIYILALEDGKWLIDEVEIEERVGNWGIEM